MATSMSSISNSSGAMGTPQVAPEVSVATKLNAIPRSSQVSGTQIRVAAQPAPADGLANNCLVIASSPWTNIKESEGGVSNAGN